MVLDEPMVGTIIAFRKELMEVDVRFDGEDEIEHFKVILVICVDTNFLPPPDYPLTFAQYIPRGGEETRMRNTAYMSLKQVREVVVRVRVRVRAPNT